MGELRENQVKWWKDHVSTVVGYVRDNRDILNPNPFGSNISPRRKLRDTRSERGSYSDLKDWTLLPDYLPIERSQSTPESYQFVGRIPDCKSFTSQPSNEGRDERFRMSRRRLDVVMDFEVLMETEVKSGTIRSRTPQGVSYL